MKFIMGFISAVVVFAIGAAVWVYGGWYSVAALDGHGALAKGALHAVMVRSVKAHAKDVTAPNDLASRTDKGFQDFDAMCVECHGAPGKEPGEIGKGLMPSPPALTAAANRWSPAELFWIVKNGVRMTGMPAFGPTHDDARLWDIVAFVKQLPNLSPEQYAALRAKSGETGEAHDHSGHSHSGHDHSAHDHGGGDQPSQDHSGHDHSGHKHDGHTE